MTLHAPAQYCVIIRSNVVVAIEAQPTRAVQKVFDDPLAVSSELARRNQLNGCMDGDYLFADSEAARYFAQLSLDFQKRLLEKSMESLSAEHVTGRGWVNPHCPRTSFGGAGA